MPSLLRATLLLVAAAHFASATNQKRRQFSASIRGWTRQLQQDSYQYYFTHDTPWNDWTTERDGPKTKCYYYYGNSYYWDHVFQFCYSNGNVSSSGSFCTDFILEEDDQTWNQLDSSRRPAKMPLIFRIRAGTTGPYIYGTGNHQCQDENNCNGDWMFTDDPCSADLFAFYPLDHLGGQMSVWGRYAIKPLSRDAVFGQINYWNYDETVSREYLDPAKMFTSYSLSQCWTYQNRANAFYGPWDGKSKTDRMSTWYVSLSSVHEVDLDNSEDSRYGCAWQQSSQCSPYRDDGDGTWRSYDGNIEFLSNNDNMNTTLDTNDKKAAIAPAGFTLPNPWVGNFDPVYGVTPSDASFTIMTWIKRDANGMQTEEWRRLQWDLSTTDIFSTYPWEEHLDDASLSQCPALGQPQCDAYGLGPDSQYVNFPFAKYTSDGRLQFSWACNEHGSGAMTKAQFQDNIGQWTNVAFTYDAVQNLRSIYVDGCKQELEPGHVYPMSFSNFGGSTPKMYINRRHVCDGNDLNHYRTLSFDDFRLFRGAASDHFISMTWTQPMAGQYSAAVYDSEEFNHLALVSSFTFDSNFKGNYSEDCAFHSPDAPTYFFKNDMSARVVSRECNNDAIRPSGAYSSKCTVSACADPFMVHAGATKGTWDDVCPAKAKCSSNCDSTVLYQDEFVQGSDSSPFLQSPLQNHVIEFEMDFEHSEGGADSRVLEVSTEDRQWIFHIWMDVGNGCGACVNNNPYVHEHCEGEGCQECVGGGDNGEDTSGLQKVVVTITDSSLQLRIGTCAAHVDCMGKGCNDALQYLDRRASLYMSERRAYTNFQVTNRSCLHVCKTNLKDQDASGKKVVVGRDMSLADVEIEFTYAHFGEHNRILTLQGCQYKAAWVDVEEGGLVRACINGRADFQREEEVVCVESRREETLLLPEDEPVRMFIHLFEGGGIALGIGPSTFGPAYARRESDSYRLFNTSDYRLVLNDEKREDFSLKDIQVRYTTNEDFDCKGLPADFKSRAGGSDRKMECFLDCPTGCGRGGIVNLYTLMGIACAIAFVIFVAVCCCRKGASMKHSSGNDYIGVGSEQSVARVNIFGGPEKNKYVAHVSLPEGERLGLDIEYREEGMLVTDCTGKQALNAGLRKGDTVTNINDLSAAGATPDLVQGIIEGTRVSNGCKYLKMLVTRPDETKAEKTGFI